MNIKEISNEVHGNIKNVKKFRKVISYDKNNIWSLDLIQMDEFNNENDGFKYLLNAIDVYSRYVWSIPMKNKSAVETTKAFEEIIKKAKTTPDKLWTDSGKEFLNKNMDELRKKYNIDIYQTYGVAKAAIIERYNRSMKSLMYKLFTRNGNHRWIDILDKIINKYNNRKHRGIQNYSPKQVYEENITLYQKPEEKPKDKPKYKINDRVRVSYKRQVFDKSYLPNWTFEIFKIHEVKDTNPYMYVLKDYKGNIIKGSFYENEIKKTKQKEDVYLINEVLKTKTIKGKKFYLVNWMGYPSNEQDWISDTDWKYLKDINEL